jgi:hypothetical protein
MEEQMQAPRRAGFGQCDKSIGKFGSIGFRRSLDRALFQFPSQQIPC